MRIFVAHIQATTLIGKHLQGFQPFDAAESLIENHIFTNMMYFFKRFWHVRRYTQETSSVGVVEVVTSTPNFH